MNQATIDEKITRLNIYHIEKRIRLELENLLEFQDLNCHGSHGKDSVKAECNIITDIIKSCWDSYEKLPGIDTKSKVMFLAKHDQLITLLGIKL